MKEIAMNPYEKDLATLITKVYCKEYIGKLKVEELKDYKENIIGYHVEMFNPEKPLTINKEGTWEEFLEFFEKELRFRAFHTIIYSEGYQVSPKC